MLFKDNNNPSEINGLNTQVKSDFQQKGLGTSDVSGLSSTILNM